MRWKVGVFGACVMLVALAVPAGAALPEPPGYSFQLEVGMAMRHFPWLHFHLEGTGSYEPGVSYVVRFTKVPWFIPQSRHQCDLSMLDPLMWPSRYLYNRIGQRDGDTLFSLHAIDDPGLREATVAVGPTGAVRWADATYSDGSRVHTELTSRSVNGYVLPATMAATIDEPYVALSANADFKDYTFMNAGASAGTSR